MMSTSKITAPTAAGRTETKRKLGLMASGALISLLASACGSSGTPETTGEEPAKAGPCDLAADYPSGPVELVVPWAAGGGTDSVARFIGSQLAEKLDTQVNVVNRDGGGGVVGHSAIANGPTDGSQIGMATVEITMMHWQGLTEINHEDLTFISQVNLDPAGITVAADAPWEDLNALLDDVESSPGEVIGSGTALGGIWDLARAGMLLESGMEPDAIRWVPSAGAAPALQELAAGGVDVSFSSLAENSTMIEAGEVRPLAVMAEERDAKYGDVPTLKEQGIDFSMGAWRGITGPAGLDENITAELNCNLEEIVHSAPYKDFMTKAGFGIAWKDTAAFTEFVATEDGAKGQIMKEAGLAK
jgi:tripartite-type tricarboxylate transporter receptor subunit TctC